MQKQAIIINGAMNSGKSTTIKEICDNLNPNDVWEIIKINDELNIKSSSMKNVFNNIFIIKVKSIFILVSAGCPTETKINIRSAYNICGEKGFDIQMIITSKRTIEKTKGFNTIKELDSLKFNVNQVNIRKINSENFMESNEWKNRVTQLLEMINNWL